MPTPGLARPAPPSTGRDLSRVLASHERCAPRRASSPTRLPKFSAFEFQGERCGLGSANRSSDREASTPLDRTRASVSMQLHPGGGGGFSRVAISKPTTTGGWSPHPTSYTPIRAGSKAASPGPGSGSPSPAGGSRRRRSSPSSCGATRPSTRPSPFEGQPGRGRGPAPAAELDR
jgi:hypothetical protein